MGRDLWPEQLEEDLRPLWHEEHGDRQSELVCIGQDLDHTAVAEALNACLLTEAEMAGGAEVWAAFSDPFAEAWERELAVADAQSHEHHDHDHTHTQ